MGVGQDGLDADFPHPRRQRKPAEFCLVYQKKAADAKETGGAAKNSPATSARMEKMAARLLKKLAKTHPELAKSTAPKLIIGEGRACATRKSMWRTRPRWRMRPTARATLIFPTK